MRILSILISLIVALVPGLNLVKPIGTEKWKNDYACVYVSGFYGWGQNDLLNTLIPYWGLLGGDAMRYLNTKGLYNITPTLHPTASAWDRACELYAQLVGERVDYGAEHSKRCGHKRYGKNYTGKAMLKEFDSVEKIHLIGYSLGGQTALRFLDLMANGSKAEQDATPEKELSGLFTGGKADWVYSLTTLAAPLNGTTAFELQSAIPHDPSATLSERLLVDAVSLLAVPPKDGRAAWDSAVQDMTIDGAAALNAEMDLPDSVYYYSIPFCTTQWTESGVCAARRATEPAFVLAANRIGRYTGTTAKGYVIDEQWLPNDGLINTYSAMAPIGAQTVPAGEAPATPGVWNVYPAKTADHMLMMGDLLFVKNIRPFLTGHMQMLHEIG